MDYNKYALIFKALGDETRIEIIDMLKDGEMCACKILEHFKITQPTLSYHMKMLVECNLVTIRKSGQWNLYSANKEILNEAINLIKKGLE
jgi:ArsR family transcriptional regulator